MKHPQKNSLLKFTLFLFLVIIFSFFSIYPLFSSNGGFEVDYPEIEGIKPVYSEGDGLPEYIIYMVYLLIIIALLVTVFSLIKGGFLWMTANDKPLQIKDARGQITSAVFGLVIVLSSFVFLNSINPSLVELEELEIIEVEEEFPPGIYLSSETTFPPNIDDYSGHIYRIEHSVRNLEEMNVRSIRIANQVLRGGELLQKHGYYYGIVIHSKRGFQGGCDFIYNENPEPQDFSVPEGISSITVIQIPLDPLEIGGVEVYLRPDFNEKYSSQYLGRYNKDFKPLSIQEVWSMDINGLYGVILSSGNNWESSDNCGVFLQSKPLPDLKGHHMNKCSPQDKVPIFSGYKSCATHYIIVPLFR